MDQEAVPPAASKLQKDTRFSHLISVPAEDRRWLGCGDVCLGLLIAELTRSPYQHL